MNKHSTPEPSQVFSGSVFHRSEKIPWSRMFVCPSLNIQPECIIKSLFSQDIISQKTQRITWFEIQRHPDICFLQCIWFTHHGFTVGPKHIPVRCHGVILTPRIFSIIKIFRGNSINKRIKTFIHPSIFPFIAAYNHRKPRMAKFMIGNAPQPAGSRS